jgi:hypothetical protein
VADDTPGQSLKNTAPRRGASMIPNGKWVSVGQAGRLRVPTKSMRLVLLHLAATPLGSIWSSRRMNRGLSAATPPEGISPVPNRPRRGRSVVAQRLRLEVEETADAFVTRYRARDGAGTPPGCSLLFQRSTGGIVRHRRTQPPANRWHPYRGAERIPRRMNDAACAANNALRRPLIRHSMFHVRCSMFKRIRLPHGVFSTGT